MDNDALSAVLDGIPRGSWASYADVALAAGGSLMHARALNGRLTRLGHQHAHSRLNTDRTNAPPPLGGPEAGRAKLKREGLRFDGARAPQEARVRALRG